MLKLFSVVVLCTFLALVNCSISPCPERFAYLSTTERGRWTGSLNLLTEYKLHGAWIRLFFDHPIKEVLVGDHLLETIKWDDDEPATGILIKNRELLLSKNVPTKVNITVVYDGDKIPTLTGYRLNGRTVCPDNDD